MNQMNYEEPEKPEHKDRQMIVQQLNMIKAAIYGLMEHIEATPECPHITEAWVQSKMTLASDYVDSVHDYVINAHSSEDPLKKEGSKVYSEEKDDAYEEDHEGEGPMGFLVAIEKEISKR